MSKAVHEWLSSDPQNIVAFHCDVSVKNSNNRLSDMLR